MSQIEITNEDIVNVEEKFNLVFDDESKIFIKCLDSKDIKACPGAGKTTSLVAKLDILSSKMPFSDNSGILVLTHTNVAVEEIKKKLGVNAIKLLSYPNHVGTFQTFINKFLVLPMYVELFGKKYKRIDDNIFENNFWEELDNNLKFGLKEKFKRGTTLDIENVKKFLKSFYIDEENKLKKFDQSRFDYNDNPPSNTYNQLRTIKLKMLQTGILTFADTYYFASLYLEKYPNIKGIFQKRFRYIFVDEAQDTDDRQFSILNTLFSEESVVQKIGDNNQAIFNFSGQQVSGWEVSANPIEIRNTKRLSSNISNQVIKVAIEPQDLNGQDVDIQPTIILFRNPANVISMFSELIVEHNLHEVGKKCFKVIGGVGKVNHNGDTIINYYPEYQSNENSYIECDTLLDKLNNINVERFQLNDYRIIILNVIKEYLKHENIADFTTYNLISFIREDNEEVYTSFKLKLFETTRKFYLKECVRDEIEVLLQMILSIFQEVLNHSTLSEVIRRHKIDTKTDTNKNIYKYENNGISFDIEVSTIHKAKGETHTATLVLETFNNGYDLFHLIKLLKGRRFAGANVNKKKLMYVGMSRATHLLCLAIHIEQRNNKTITLEDISQLESAGFRIIHEPI